MTSAQGLIEAADALLLDFDGPVTALMPPPFNARAADRARAALGDSRLPPDIRTTSDHLAVLRWTVEHGRARLAEVEQACTDAEVECAQHSEPSPEIRRLLHDAHGRRIPVAIVSNNSEEALRAFLQRFPWASTISCHVGRTLPSAHLLKPNPFLINTALSLLDVAPDRCIFLGDSVSDVYAGRAAGVPVVGLAKSTARGHQLAAAGAIALLTR